MKITGTVYFHGDSIINGKKVSEMSEAERSEFAKNWVAKHGGEVKFINTPKQ